MMAQKTEKKERAPQRAQLGELLAQVAGQTAPRQVRQLAGDGSDRLFYRITGDFPCVAVFPAAGHAKAMAEARSSYTIACHLSDAGVPVPQVLGYDRHRGIILFEDVGDVHLHALVAGRGSFSDVLPLYRQAVDALLRLQIDGAKGFDERCCWDTARYDMSLMLERESGYFLDAFCREYMGRLVDESGLHREFVEIARSAARQRHDFLLHRDFQSRNLMVHEGRVRIIDFQGARFGPLAYDLASLLLDPYAGLLPTEQEQIFAYYVEQAAALLADFDGEGFRQGYTFLALQRNLQILGAFAFLSQRKAKVFFEQYIMPAALSLQQLLDGMDDRLPQLRALVADICAELREAQAFAQAGHILMEER